MSAVLTEICSSECLNLGGRRRHRRGSWRAQRRGPLEGESFGLQYIESHVVGAMLVASVPNLGVSRFASPFVLLFLALCSCATPPSPKCGLGIGCTLNLLPSSVSSMYFLDHVSFDTTVSSRAQKSNVSGFDTTCGRVRIKEVVLP